jgi:nicotinate-nucleotide adenylyltransferase
MRSVGLLGGTYNPIHFGHLRIAEEITENLHLDEVRFIPSASPPHKPVPEISAEHRAAMVQLAIENNPKFKCDCRELQRTGASYTIDTLISLREELGSEASLHLIMGSDAFTQFDAWHRWQALIQYAHIILVKRPEPIPPQKPLSSALTDFLRDHYTEDAALLNENAAGFIIMQNVTALSISSTDIRERLKNKHSTRYLMPDSVAEYITKHQLYSK